MKTTIALAAALTLASLTAACGTLRNPWAGQDHASNLPGQVEPIHAAAIGQDQAVFWVSSNGCTSKGDLTVVVRRSGDASVIILRRVNEDRCHDVQPQGVEMRWSFEELGLAPGSRVSVENPYQVTPTA